MPSTLPMDPFATKGIEYLWVIFFLAAFVAFWRLLNAPSTLPALAAAARTAGAWFRVALDRRYHRSHAWVRSEAPGRLRIGLDDFAQRLLGPITRVSLPEAGFRVRRGERLMTVSVGDRRFDLRSPVSGTILRRNTALDGQPDLINAAPYDAGWVAEVRPRRLQRRRLLDPSAALDWMRSLEASLRLQLSPALGTVLQDGGTPVGGLARVLEPAGWDRLIEEHLMARLVDAGPGSSGHEDAS